MAAYTTIDDPEAHFQCKIYTGNSSTQSITLDGDTDMQPDMIWFKMRSHADNHVMIDSVRGTNKAFYPDIQDAETTQTHYFTSFDSDGFGLGNSGIMNTSSRTYVGWCWKAGGSASSNSNGANITSNVSANTDAGFSIVSYTGDNNGASSTIGHGLGETPDLVILKPRSYAGAMWWAQKNRSNKVLEVSATNAEADPSSSFGGGGLKYSTFTSTVFGGTAGTSNADLFNENNQTYMAYCYKEKQGYSKIGQYVGNGDATNGPFVYTGFKPAFLIIKEANGSDVWAMYDNKRIGYNTANYTLEADGNGSEGTATGRMHLLSNGFRITYNWTPINTSGQTYIYMAMAESPFVNSKSVPNNAR